MSDGDTAAHEPPGLAEALDWTAGRTWLVFGIYGVALGATSGVIIVGTEVIGAAFILRPALIFDLIPSAMSLPLHLGVLFVLSKLIPLREAGGRVVHGYRILADKLPDPFKGFWPYFAFSTTVWLPMALVIAGQPFFELRPTVGYQAWLPLIFIMSGAHFPASHLMAKRNRTPDLE
jgi:hypothetical protein